MKRKVGSVGSLDFLQLLWRGISFLSALEREHTQIPKLDIKQVKNLFAKVCIWQQLQNTLKNCMVLSLSLSLFLTLSSLLPHIFILMYREGINYPAWSSFNRCVQKVQATMVPQGSKAPWKIVLQRRLGNKISISSRPSFQLLMLIWTSNLLYHTARRKKVYFRIPN